MNVSRDGQAPVSTRVKPVGYAPPTSYRYAVEVITSDELGRRVARNDARGVERVDFHCLILLETGHYRHMVDFEHFECGPRAVLRVRPGQVHRFGPLKGWSGWLLVFRSDLLPSTERTGSALESFERLAALPPLSVLSAPMHRAVIGCVNQMAADARLDAPQSLVEGLLRRQLEALLLRLELAQPRPSDGRAAVDAGALERARRFEELVEREHRRWHSLGPYTRRLGCSEKTLSRAMHATRGKSAKAVLTDRRVLEAKRLLVHSGDSVARIAELLGFEEATNFVKFFKRETRVTPGAFRHQNARVI